jgi:hypothetical protein
MRTTVTIDDELVARAQFRYSGCSAVDLLLIASVLLTSDAVLWTPDMNLKARATRLEISFSRPL